MMEYATTPCDLIALSALMRLAPTQVPWEYLSYFPAISFKVSIVPTRCSTNLLRRALAAVYKQRLGAIRLLRLCEEVS